MAAILCKFKDGGHVSLSGSLRVRCTKQAQGQNRQCTFDLFRLLCHDLQLAIVQI
mgnify:CR=1 FL=1